MSAGPELGVERERKNVETCSSCSNFVLAVRVRKIKLSFREKNVVVEDLFEGELNSYGNEVDGPRFSDMNDSDKEGDDAEREIKDVEAEDWALGAMYTPRGFKNEIVIDKDGEGCALFW